MTSKKWYFTFAAKQDFVNYYIGERIVLYYYHFCCDKIIKPFLSYLEHYQYQSRYSLLCLLVVMQDCVKLVYILLCTYVFINLCLFTSWPKRSFLFYLVTSYRCKRSYKIQVSSEKVIFSWFTFPLQNVPASFYLFLKSVCI